MLQGIVLNFKKIILTKAVSAYEILHSVMSF